LAIAAHEPFDAKQLAASKGKLQVALLTRKPGAGAKRKALGLSTREDCLAIDDRELYWLPSGGMSESELDLKALATLLGPMTWIVPVIRTAGMRMIGGALKKNLCHDFLAK
jgi:hypothetical protein